MRTYSRWLPELRRREEYAETTDRFLGFMQQELGADLLTPSVMTSARNAISKMDAMPSMRAFWAAGEAARRNHITMYNCAYAAINDVAAFGEALYILMCGTGFGFSVERQYVDQLPEIQPRTGNTVHVYVEDSKEGWASALLAVLHALWRGDDVTIDDSQVRPRGARLLTMGGRASGPEPLRDLFTFLIKIFNDRRARKQRKLTSLDCLDIMNKIAEIVVVGGVRRSSEICLSDLDDRLVAEAKMGEFWSDHPHRSMSNNSAVYNGKTDVVTFLEEWTTLIKSKAGERGIFNREGAQKQMTASGRRKPWEHIGTNPCGEIILRDQEFCNLSEVVVRANDNLDSLKRKVRIATAFGAWQSTFTEFPFLREGWARNCNEERLLGVSLTGIMDNAVLNNVNDKAKKWLSELKGVTITEAERWAKRLEINMSAAITCVKPSGTVSQLVNCASGIHNRYADHYMRRYRISATDPLFRMMRDQGVKWYPEVGQDPATASTMVLEFPIASPTGAKTRHDMTAMQQLEHWRMVKEFWCEHNPSVTVYVGEDEWVETASWVYGNFEDVCGISFLPKSNHVYQLAPYEEITREQYTAALNEFPRIDYSKLRNYEEEDNTQGSQSYACVGDKCEL
jgi:ribonucleoside-triphosphate reductase